MLVLVSIVAIFLILIIGFLFAPVTLYIDTDEDRYEIFQQPVFQFSLIHPNNIPALKFNFAGINIPLKSNTKKREAQTKKGKTKSRFHRSAAAWRFMITRLVRSFTVKHIVADLDTDDFVLNAQLIPVFQLLSKGPVQLSNNFSGRAYFHLEMYNRPVRILWIFIQFLTKK